MERPAQVNPKRVWLDEKDCERMNRPEYEAMRGLMAAISYTANADKDLRKRLECVPSGRQRMAMVLGGIKAIADDLIGTMTTGQCRQLQNTMKDMELRMVPKMTSMSQNVIFDKELAKGLIDTAQEKCRGCVEDAETCRDCSLYKILEGLLPLKEYDGLICPYSISEWED